MKVNRQYRWWRFWAYKSTTSGNLHYGPTVFHDFGIRKLFLLTLRNRRPICVLFGRSGGFYLYRGYSPPGTRKWFIRALR